MSWISRFRKSKSISDGRSLDAESLEKTLIRYEQHQDQISDAEAGGTALSIRSPESNALHTEEQKDQETDQISVWNKGDVILEKYEVLDVQEGGMGYVYIVKHNDWHVMMAIKSPKQMMFSDEALFARVLREANAWINLGLHPHIAYCYYVRQINDVPYIFIEYLDGGSLRDWITDMRCYDLKVGLDMAIQFCHGMDYANKHGMIHRDIKPENIMMTKDGILKVTDFGLVRTERVKKSRQRVVRSYQKSQALKKVDENDSNSPLANTREVGDGHITQVSTIMGSADYMSPEQWVDPQSVDIRTDIYAFGVCLYEMFCGTKPYRSVSIEANKKHKKPCDPVKFRADIPPALADLLRKSVALDRNERHGSFEELRQELLMIYRSLFHEEAPHAELETLALRSDGLNNRAVSYAELGREREAIELWTEALNENPQHPEALYNRGLILWRRAQLTDKDLVEQFAAVRANERWTASYLLALVHLERGDVGSAMPILERVAKQVPQALKGVEAPPNARQALKKLDQNDSNLAPPNAREDSEIQSILELAQSDDIGTYECLHTFQLQALDKVEAPQDTRSTSRAAEYEENINRLSCICLSSDGRHALLGNGNTLHFWDVLTGECLRTFEGHSAEMICLDLSADNLYAVSGSKDGTMQLWEVDSGQCLRLFKGYRAPISSVSISSDGCYALSRRVPGQRGEAVQLWDVSTGECLRTYWDNGVTSICLSSDGRHALSVSREKIIRRWEISTGRYLNALEGHTGEVNSISLSEDGGYALSGSTDETIRLWDTATGRCIRTFEGHKDKVTSVCLSDDAQYVLSGSRDRTMRLWELSTGRCLYTFEGHTDAVSSVRLSSDNRHALSYGEDKTIRVWKLAPDGTRVFPLRLSRSRSKAELAQVEAQAKELLSRGEEALEGRSYNDALALIRQVRELPGYEYEQQSMELWMRLSRFCRLQGLRMARHVKTLTEHLDAVNSICLSTDGGHAVSGGSDKTVRFWNISQALKEHGQNDSDSPQALPEKKLEQNFSQAFSKSLSANAREIHRLSTRDRVTSVSLCSDTHYAVSGSEDGTLQIWNMAAGECLHTTREHRGPVYSVSISSDGRHALSGSRDSTIRLWNISTGECLEVYKGHIGAVYTVGLSSDGRYAISGGIDKTMRLWSLSTGKCLHTFRGHTDVLHSVDLSQDSRYALSGSRDNTMRFWEVATGQCMRTFEGHANDVCSVRLSADSRYALSGSLDSTARLWDVTTGQCLYVFRQHDDGVTSVDLSADGRYVLLGSMDRTVQLWEMDWELEALDAADWDEEARIYLESFLISHTVSVPKVNEPGNGNVDRGKPVWTEENFEELVRQLQYSGYGWLQPEGVRRVLREMTLRWKRPPELEPYQTAISQ